MLVHTLYWPCLLEGNLTCAVTLVCASGRRTLQFVLDVDFVCYSSAFYGTPQLTLGFVSGSSEFPLRAQPEPLWPLESSSGLLFLSGGKMPHIRFLVVN